jgi:glycosyltransferase involved in cell wall biosynthesis
MKIIFIGSLFPQDRIKEIVDNSNTSIDNAANNFQYALLNGLIFYYPNLEIITQPSIRTYPIHYKKIHFKTSLFSFNQIEKNSCLGFINLPIIKHFHKTRKLYKKLKDTLCKKEKTLIFLYSIHSPFLQAVTEIKKRNKNVKVCLIAPDLPQFMSESKNPIYRFLKNLDSLIIQNCLKYVDAFVLLSDQMVSALKIEKTPWVRVEGIYSSSEINLGRIQKEDKTILYTGTLAKRYGIINLIQAFNLIKSKDYNLWICGEGDSKKEVIKASIKDDRIKYFGQLPTKKIFELQKKATVLINPRTPDGIYTKFSFPSKTMEYLASGTPTIMYRLDGVPDEYYNFVYVIEEQGIEGLQNTLKLVCEKDPSELHEFGEKASMFILKNKNPLSQVKKIFEMVSQII